MSNLMSATPWLFGLLRELEALETGCTRRKLIVRCNSFSWPRSRARSASLAVPGRLLILATCPLVRRRYAIGDVPFFTYLKIDGSGQFFVTVQGTTRDDHGISLLSMIVWPVLDHGDPSSDQRDIEALPFSRLAGSSGEAGRKPYTPPIW